MENTVEIKILAVLKDSFEQSLLLKSTKTGLNFLRGSWKPQDTSPIFAATRIFVKKVFSEHPEYIDYFNTTYLKWMGRFCDAQIIRDEAGNCTFLIEIPKEELESWENEKLQSLIIDDVQSDYPKLFKEYDMAIKELEEIKDFYANSDKIKYHYAILNCEANVAWDNFYEALYMGWFKNKGEVWTRYRVAENEFPTADELKKIKAIVISGSEWNVYDSTVTQIPIFLERLRNLIRYHPEMRIMGVCFGCQSLAQSLGGRVEKMKLGGKPMLLMREKVNLLNGFYEKLASKAGLASIPKTKEEMYIVELHGDNVTVLPEGATLFGTSDRTPVECWGMGDNIIAFQGHFELNPGIMMGKILPELKIEFADRYDMEKVIDEAEKSLMSGSYDQRLLGGLLEKFLKEKF